VVELTDPFAYQQPLWLEGLGLCAEGRGGEFLRDGGPGRLHVNPSGGMLCGNPMMIAGLYRAAESVLQLRGEAGARQVKGASRALAHSSSGPAGQFQSVMVLEA
jgi:acetyl-CoA C-acetyltransferase